MQGFSEIATPLAWQVSMEKKSILSLPIVQRTIAGCHLEINYLRLSYSGDLKTRKNYKSGSLETPFHSV
jgi:hypothetical protein